MVCGYCCVVGRSLEVLRTVPAAGKLPQSPLDYCSHCGKEGNRVEICATCINCGCALGTKVTPRTEFLFESRGVHSDCLCGPQIDYGAMTDAMVWGFVFEDLGLPMMYGRRLPVSFAVFLYPCVMSLP
jgi:hypothetical protein